MTTEDAKAKFSFQFLGGRRFPSLESKETQDLLLKWSMKGRVAVQAFCFDEQFHIYQKEDFALAFFQDPSVLQHLKVLSESGKWVFLGVKASAVKAEHLACTELSMAFFDRLTSQHVVRDNGYIVKCLDEVYEDFTISDELRKMLLDPESEHYNLYDDSERDEFLFRLFRHFCLGGSVCQYEDQLQPYLDVTKGLYKDLITVQKDPSTQGLSTTTIALKVEASKDDEVFFPGDRDHRQDFAYLLIDPLKRHVTVLYHKFGASLWES